MRQASYARLPRHKFDLVAGNRHGQQLHFADMFKAARNSTVVPDQSLPASVLEPIVPVTYHQGVFFQADPDLSCGLTRMPKPRHQVLAAALEAYVAAYARDRRWSPTYTWSVRAGIRVLLGLQDTPGAPIVRSEAGLLSEFNLPIGSVCEVLASVGMLEDDRVPAFQRWFDRQLVDLPGPMTSELATWFDIMCHGSTVAPRRRPRSQQTTRLYVRYVLPALRAWADGGHHSLREIAKEDLLAVLPPEGLARAQLCRAVRSIFRILKARKLVFADPTARMHTWVESGKPPLPVELDALREALISPDPARAAIAALVAFHGLRSAQLRSLRLTDIRDRSLHVDGRSIPLAEPVGVRIRTYLEHRASRWPGSINPHLFIHFRTWFRTEPVGSRWVWLTLGIDGGVEAVRQDRILHEAHATGGDTRRLCDLFGLSINAASRYTATVNHPDLRKVAGESTPSR